MELSPVMLTSYAASVPKQQLCKVLQLWVCQHGWGTSVLQELCNADVLLEVLLRLRKAEMRTLCKKRNRTCCLFLSSRSALLAQQSIFIIHWQRNMQAANVITLLLVRT